MNRPSPFDKLTTSSVFYRRNHGWLRRWLYLGVIATLIFGAYQALLAPAGDKSAADCKDGSSCAPVAEASSLTSLAPSVASVPCPYCSQSADLWRSETATAPPQIDGKAAAVVEGSCGQLIYGLDQDAHYPPASLTKIVTAMVTLDSAKLSDRVAITVDGWDMAAQDESSIMGLEPGMNLSVQDLLYGLLLPSGNDAALALADYAGGESSFVNRMNQRVQRMGLRNTHFMNPDGRDSPNHYSSAFDMALLGRELMSIPTLRQIAGTQTYQPDWDGPMLWNADDFLYNYPGATGVKLGYTDDANFTIVSSAIRDGREIFVSVMDSMHYYTDSTKLLNWAFANTRPSCAT